MLNSQNSISQNARIINNSNPSQMEDIEHTSNSDLNVHSSPSSQLTGIPIMSQTNVRTPRAANMDYFKNLSSSSLRKKTCKPIHCFFCFRYNSRRDDIEKHLKESNECFLLYCRKYRVNVLDAVLIKLFKCLACEKNGNFQLKRHLSANENCNQYYKTRFNLLDWEHIKKKITNLCKPSQNNRRSFKRRLENVAYQQRKRMSKTVIESLNCFNKDISLSNYRYCVCCKQHLPESSAIEVTNDDTTFEEMDLINHKEFKRLNKFWICLICKGSKESIPIVRGNAIMKVLDIDGKKVMYPTDDIQTDQTEIEIDTLILIPNKLIKTQYMQIKKFSPNLYRLEETNNCIVSTLYNMRKCKFMERKLYADVYDGDIGENMNANNKRLKSINKIYDDSMIRLSSSWKKQNNNLIYCQFKQYGNVAIGFSLDINSNNIETMATSLICDGQIVTLQYAGNVNNEHKTKYFVHNHNNIQDCDENCAQTELREGDRNLSTKNIPTFVANLHQKHNGLIEQLIKNPNFELFSQDYFSTIDFYTNGSARIKGCLWTQNCSFLNENISSSYITGNDIEEEAFLQYIEQSILTTSNEEEIKYLIECSDEEAKYISGLVNKYQIKENDASMYIPLPSYECMFRKQPINEAYSNLVASKELLFLYKDNLLKLTELEKQNLTTRDWLENMSKKSKFILINDNTISIEIESLKTEFIVDEKLDMFITKYGCSIGFYHYALSCSSKEFSVILKRSHIMDCYIVPYNPTLLKAFSNRIEVVPLNSEFAWWDFEEKYSKNLPNLDNTILSELIESHSLVSVAELYALADTKKIHEIYSAPPAFISTHEINKPRFKKTTTKTDKTYEYPGNGFFEPLSSNVLRHIGRLNGEFLLLVESGLWYDLLPSTEGKKIFDLYKDKLDRIEDSDVFGVYGSAFPKYLLCENTQVMKIRKSRKLLVTPTFTTLSEEYKYAQVALFYPLKPRTSIDVDRIGDKFQICIINCYLIYNFR